MECIEWAKSEKRTFLRQALEVRCLRLASHGGVSPAGAEPHADRSAAVRAHAPSCPQARLVSLYFDTKRYQEALQLGEFPLGGSSGRELCGAEPRCSSRTAPLPRPLPKRSSVPHPAVPPGPVSHSSGDGASRQGPPGARGAPL